MWWTAQEEQLHLLVGQAPPIPMGGDGNEAEEFPLAFPWHIPQGEPYGEDQDEVNPEEQLFALLEQYLDEEDQRGPFD
jgi:hypothetical protein